MVTEEDGTLRRPSRPTYQFDKIVALLGLPPTRFHDLRHLAATLMLADDADLKVAQLLLGHSSPLVTGDVYTSVLPDLETSAAEAATALVPRALG